MERSSHISSANFRLDKALALVLVQVLKELALKIGVSLLDVLQVLLSVGCLGSCKEGLNLLDLSHDAVSVVHLHVLQDQF